MSALFCKKQGLKTMNYSKNVLMKGLFLSVAIYQMQAVLNLLIIHENEKNDIILLLVKQNDLICCKCQRQLAPHLDYLPKLIL